MRARCTPNTFWMFRNTSLFISVILKWNKISTKSDYYNYKIESWNGWNCEFFIVEKYPQSSKLSIRFDSKTFHCRLVECFWLRFRSRSFEASTRIPVQLYVIAFRFNCFKKSIYCITISNFIRCLSLSLSVLLTQSLSFIYVLTLIFSMHLFFCRFSPLTEKIEK